MRRIIKWALNHLPRTLLQRLAGWMVPLAGLFYRGRRVECPVCGSHYRKFLPYGYVTSRPNALCPHCLSLERHRLLWLWLVRETRLLDDCPRLLHIAPEVCLMRHLDRLYAQHPERYVTADLESPLAKLHFDVQQIPLEDGFAEVLLCNHILEHVADDRLAMRELFRVLRPGGWGVILSPVDRTRATTFEDNSITDPDERTRIFGQYDHRRIYGRDYADRLREAGFEVLELDYAAACTAEERRRYALCKDWLYIVRRPAESDLIRKAPASVNRGSAAGKAAAGETPVAAPAGKTTAAPIPAAGEAVTGEMPAAAPAAPAGKTTAAPAGEPSAAARPANAPTPEYTSEPASRPVRA